MSDPRTTPGVDVSGDLDRRVLRLETQRNGAMGLVLLFAGALAAGAWDVTQRTTRLDERVTRMAVDVQGATAAIARIDRMEERLTAMSRSVDRIESDVSRTRESVEALRNELANRRAATVADPPHPSPRAFARR
ncbi:MAG: hypothetical protein U0325_31545 [Polyangiales bacterium]